VHERYPDGSNCQSDWHQPGAWALDWHWFRALGKGTQESGFGPGPGCPVIAAGLESLVQSKPWSGTQKSKLGECCCVKLRAPRALTFGPFGLPFGWKGTRALWHCAAYLQCFAHLQLVSL